MCGQIVRKQGLGRDPAVQTHEDALCLVFLETQYDELAERMGDDKTIEILRKTAAKMSPAGLAAAQGLPFSPEGRGAAGPRPRGRLTRRASAPGVGRSASVVQARLPCAARRVDVSVEVPAGERPQP